jgi:hypothetical protein
MNTVAKYVLIGALGAGVIPAYADDYSMAFTEITGSGQNATGTFTYSGGTFSNFDVSWDGLAFDLTAAANAATGVGGCPGGAGFSTFNYLEGSAGCTSIAQGWFAEAFGPTEFFLAPEDAGFTVAPSAGSALQYGVPSEGSFVVTDTTIQSAPEIDPASAASGLALLVGGLAVLRGRRPRRLTHATAPVRTA